MMETRNDTALHRGADRTPEDHDLLDESARSAHRSWSCAAIVALDVLAISALIVWVVIPKLT